MIEAAILKSKRALMFGVPTKKEADALDAEQMQRQAEGMRLMCGMLTKEEADALDAELAYHARRAE